MLAWGRSAVSESRRHFFACDLGWGSIRRRNVTEGLSAGMRSDLAVITGVREWLADPECVIVDPYRVTNMAFQGTDALDSAAMYTARDANFDARAQDIGEMIPPRVDTKQKCTVCLEELQGGEQMVQLVCGHAFHQACCDSWAAECLRTERESSCAVCRGPLTVTDHYLCEADSDNAEAVH